MAQSHDNYNCFSDDWTVEPRQYQQRTISRVLSAFAGTNCDRDTRAGRRAKSVLVESPTGSGKTIMGLAVASHMQRVYGLSVGWSAMRRNLLAQANQENHRWGFDVELDLISMFEKCPPAVDLLVIDEGHHDSTRSMANLHAQIRPKYVLGLTATPFRTDGARLCFDHVIREANIRQLIREGYLSRYHLYTVPSYSPAMVARMLIEEPDRWGKSIAFFLRREQCEECHRLLSDQGIASEVVTAETDRERQLADFAKGRVDILVNMEILTEGFDCPALKTVFCRPSGAGCTIQMAGRVFRQHPELLYKQIVQSKDTKHAFVKTAEPDEQYVWVHGEWRSLKANRQVGAIGDCARHLIARANVKLPARLNRPVC